MSARLPIINGRQWREHAEHEPPAIVDRLLPSKAMAFIAGEPGVGKSWLLWDLALSVTSGRPFMGQYPVVTRGAVLVIASEGSRAASIGRAWAIAKGKGLDPDATIDQLHILWCAGFSLADPVHVSQVAEHVRAQGVRLVLVDTLHGAWGGRENDSDAWGAVVRTGLRPLTEAGATVALVHHTAKASEGTSGRRAGQMMRGSSAMHASRDCLLVLTKAKDDDQRVKVTVELRDDAPVRPFTFATPSERVGVGDSFSLDWQEAGDAQSANVNRGAEAIRRVKADPGRHTRTQLADIVGGRKTNTLATIDGWIESGDIVKLAPGARLWHRGDVPQRNGRGNVTEPLGNTNGNAAARTTDRLRVNVPAMYAEVT